MSQSLLTPPWEFLNWDSAHFGHPIARINRPLSTSELLQFERWHDEQRIVCAYYLCPIESLEALYLALDSNFNLVDIRVQLDWTAKAIKPDMAADSSIRRALPQDMDQLIHLAVALHQDSRFFVDQRFPRNKAEELYATWMRKECEDTSGVVYVKTDPDNKPVGYVSCHAVHGTGNIGLFGVAVNWQGRGIGGALLAHGLSWMLQQGANSITVITQGKSTGALASYTGQGFRIKSMSYWLHRWSNCERNE
jgi:ribosomal protein S18 acetylase RimI-like enzyme